MRMTTPTRIPNSAILQLIAKGYLSYQLAQEFHISKPAVSKRIRHLAKKGYINTAKKGVIMTLSLTAKGLAELHPVGDDLVASPSPQKPKGGRARGGSASAASIQNVNNQNVNTSTSQA